MGLEATCSCSVALGVEASGAARGRVPSHHGVVHSRHHCSAAIMIGINQDEFVQQADRHGVITTRHARSATIFQGQDLLKAITLTIHHEPEAIITLFPKSAVATQ
jgi:hypothetical protein